jgi:hypothetical protein
MYKRVELSLILCEESAIILTNEKWPNQPRPGPNSRSTWKKFLKIFCHEGSELLEAPLGNWLPLQTSHTKGNYWFYNTQDDLVYHNKNNEWTKMTFLRRRTYRVPLIETEEKEDHENIKWLDMIPVDQNSHDRDTHKLTWSDRDTLAVKSTILEDWQSYVEQLTVWERELLLYCKFLQNETMVLASMMESDNIITVVSDGGCNLATKKGSFGWVLSSNSEIMVQGQGIVPGEPMSSHRVEAFGKLAWITFLIHFAKFKKIDIKCRIASFCDNMAIVRNTTISNTMESSAKALSPNFDVIKAVSVYQRKLKGIAIGLCDTQHVKAHQDQRKKYNLSTEEKLNIKADQIASETLNQAAELEYSYELPGYEAVLLKEGKAQYSGESGLLLWRKAEFELQDYYCNKFGWDIKTLHSINWAGLRMARDRLSPGKQVFSIKQTIGWLPTGDRLHIQGSNLIDCPMCGEEENIDHIIICSVREKANIDLMDRFNEYLEKIDTDPKIIKTMSNGLKDWMNLKITDNSNKHSDVYATAMIAQDNIGWNMLCRGYLAVNWAQIQERHYDGKNRKTGDGWCAKISTWWITAIQEVWVIRNKHIHDIAINGKLRSQEETYSQLRKLYGTQDDMSAFDRKIFGMPIEERIKFNWKKVEVQYCLTTTPGLDNWKNLTTTTKQ